MKLSKSLLKTIAVAVSVGTVAASCNKSSNPTPEKGKPVEHINKSGNGTSLPSDPCPGCGMG